MYFCTLPNLYFSSIYRTYRLSKIIFHKILHSIFRAIKGTIRKFVYLKNVYEICRFRDSFFSWYESFSPFPFHIQFPTKLNCSQYHIQPSILSFLSEFNDPVNRKTIKQIDACHHVNSNRNHKFNNVVIEICYC